MLSYDHPDSKDMDRTLELYLLASFQWKLIHRSISGQSPPVYKPSASAAATIPQRSPLVIGSEDLSFRDDASTNLLLIETYLHHYYQVVHGYALTDVRSALVFGHGRNPEEEGNGLDFVATSTLPLERIHVTVILMPDDVISITASSSRA